MGRLYDRFDVEPIKGKDITFDFGDEEENGSQYSEVLTYIIYK